MDTLNIQNLSITRRTGQKIVPRERLINLLRNNMDKSLFLIYSPPGYGKTSIAKSFVESQSNDFVWLNVTPRINHIYSFFKYVVLSFRKLDKNFGENTIQLIESRQEKNQLAKNIKLIVSEIVKTFMNEYKTAFQKDVILVLDDAQYITGSRWSKHVFTEIFSNIPSNLHIVLITDQFPDFHFSELIEKDAIIKIGIEDLIFRFDEIVSLINGIYSFDYSDNEVKLLEKNLGGWITGIHLILQSFGKDLKNLKLDFQLIPENIFNILAKSIYDRLDDRSKDFMLRSSLLEDFDPPLCNHILDIEDSYDIINGLMAKNLIMKADPNISSNGHSSTYSYQILLKKFLNARLHETYNEDEVRYMLVKAAEYYYNKKDMTGAINCFMLAKEYDSAVPIISGSFMQLFKEGKFEILWNWLETLENENETRNPNIIFFLGVMYKFYIGDLDKSLSYLQKATEMFRNINDRNSMVKVILAKAGVLLNSGKTKEVINELTELLDVQTSEETKATLLYHLAHAYYHNAEYEKTISLLNQSLELSDGGSKINKHSDIYNLFGHIELIKGNFINSVVFYERVLEGNPNLFNRFETLCNLVLLTSQNGRYSKSRKYLAQIDVMLKNFPTPVFQIPYLLAKQAYFFEELNYRENLNVLDEIMKIADSMNHKVYKYLSARLISETYYYMKDLEKSREYYNMADKYLDKDNELEQVEMKTSYALLYRDGMNGTYEQTLLDAFEYYKTHNYLYSEVQISYRLANYYLEKNDLNNAKKYLGISLSLSSENGYVSFFRREFTLSNRLMEFAQKNQMYTDFLNPIITNFKQEKNQ
jgi:ATP/maltotriose-dependent transcriptional regulator MalT